MLGRVWNVPPLANKNEIVWHGEPVKSVLLTINSALLIPFNLFPLKWSVLSKKNSSLSFVDFTPNFSDRKGLDIQFGFVPVLE
jgi:hypothetical protein